MARKKKKVLVLGVGNILLGDEGVGVRAIEFLEKRYAAPENVVFADGGTGGARLLSLMRGFTHIIIVDAVRSGSAPGTVVRVNGEDIPGRKLSLRSAHELGLAELLTLASFEGCTPRVTLIGVEPGEIRPELGLSPSVSEKLQEVSELIRVELEKIGVSLRERKGSEKVKSPRPSPERE